MISIKTDRKTKNILVGVEKLNKSVKEALQEGFEKMGSNMVRTFENNILNEPKFGKKRKIYGEVKRLSGKNEHVSSAPGQTPALLTGEYFEKIYFQTNGKNGLIFGNKAPHSVYLEDGTEKMESRPGLFNAIKQNLKNNRQFLEESLDEKLKS